MKYKCIGVKGMGSASKGTKRKAAASGAVAAARRQLAKEVSAFFSKGILNKIYVMTDL